MSSMTLGEAALGSGRTYDFGLCLAFPIESYLLKLFLRSLGVSSQVD